MSQNVNQQDVIIVGAGPAGSWWPRFLRGQESPACPLNGTISRATRFVAMASRHRRYIG